MVRAGLALEVRGRHPAEVVHGAGGASVVLKTAARRQESIAALNLRHLDAPLSAGGGVVGADDGVDGVAGGAGVNIEVLTSESSTEHRNSLTMRIGDCESVLSTVT